MVGQGAASFESRDSADSTCRTALPRQQTLRAQIAAAEGAHRKAAILLAATARMRERRGTPPEPIDLLDLGPVQAALDAALAPDDRARAASEGRTLGLSAAVALAMS